MEDLTWIAPLLIFGVLLIALISLLLVALPHFLSPLKEGQKEINKKIEKIESRINKIEKSQEDLRQVIVEWIQTRKVPPGMK